MTRWRKFTTEERAALWEGWKRGLSLVDIGRGLDRRASSVLWVIRSAGGYPPDREGELGDRSKRAKGKIFPGALRPTILSATLRASWGAVLRRLVGR